MIKSLYDKLWRILKGPQHTLTQIVSIEQKVKVEKVLIKILN